MVSSIADSKGIINGSAGIGGFALFASFGIVPKIGILRAAYIGWRSYFKKAHPLSVRADEIRLLMNKAKVMEKGSYITVIGGKGHGKSCLTDTALNGHPGVVTISTSSGGAKNDIIDDALRKITGYEVQFVKSAFGSINRVLFFYSWIFKRLPIVVVRVSERFSGQQFADLPSAVRSLADDYGLRVIVDGPPNSIPPELLTTTRERVITVEPMARAQIESIPEFEGLIGFIKAHKLDGAVWEVLGGSPTGYLKLQEAFKTALRFDTGYLKLQEAFKTALRYDTAADEVIHQVKKHLHSVLVGSWGRLGTCDEGQCEHRRNHQDIE